MSAYVIVLIEEIVDPGELDRYREIALPTLAEHKPEVLLRMAQAETVEGPEVGAGVVLLKFESHDAARNWFDSPEYQRALGHRRKGAKCHAVIVDAG
jgi:uncharacterized protein (DUF1330 family)